MTVGEYLALASAWEARQQQMKPLALIALGRWLRLKISSLDESILHLTTSRSCYDQSARSAAF